MQPTNRNMKYSIYSPKIKKNNKKQKRKGLSVK